MTETKRDQFVSLLNEYRTETSWAHDYGLDDLVTDELYQSYIDDYDAADKPVIPQGVADWIKATRDAGNSLMDAFCMAYEADDNLGDWLDISSDTFARAWLDGYTVEAHE